MSRKSIIESNIEQGTAAWIDYLKHLRLASLFEALKEQDFKLEAALDDIDQAFYEIKEFIIDRNRGGANGIHGFIAEAVEVGIRQARESLRKYIPGTFWDNDNGPSDLSTDLGEFQMKFVQKNYSLDAIVAHLKKYPDFIKKGGKYIIPSDFYEKLKEMYEKTPSEAKLLARKDYRLWELTQKVFKSDDISFSDVEPSTLRYADSQKEAYGEALRKEIDSLKKENEEIKQQIESDHGPSLADGLKATAISAGIEGGTAFIMAIKRKKAESGKAVKDFSKEDWTDIVKTTGWKTGVGAVRGGVVYVATNFEISPAAFASALVTATAGVAEAAHKHKTGKLSREEMIDTMEDVSLSAAISAVSSYLGQVAIPVPVLGAVIGNTIGHVIYQTAKDCASSEKRIMERYYREMTKQVEKYDVEYKNIVDAIKKSTERFDLIVSNSLSAQQWNKILTSSNSTVELAREVGVPEDQIIHNIFESFRLFRNGKRS